ncbi:Cof-type HAD-IIB family hydrolase [Fredinandcohnia sp. 179-A 10B2 NHS]|uniref:Cof-type HAD-IIB family hydrolase n=1 Tax=Fredinandcohnia sp. 179-A 10B2 NHS TaxID=3235176 RepID=UPI0039A2965C
MTEYKVVFLDIDGTILRPDDTIENTTKNAIAQLQAKGIEVVLATGRPLHEILEIGEELSITSFIAYNGAFAIHKGDTIYKEPMSAELVEELLHIARENDHQVVLYTKETNVFTTIESAIVKDFIKTFHLKQNKILEEHFQEDVLGATIITNAEDIDSKYRHLTNIHLSQVNVEGMKSCRDVIRDKVNKGVAVEAFLTRAGYSSDNAIAFGDGMNDKEMLSFVGTGFAMGNAHPDLPRYAKYTTTDVEHSGVYNGLKSIGLID